MATIFQHRISRNLEMQCNGIESKDKQELTESQLELERPTQEKGPWILIIIKYVKSS